MKKQVFIIIALVLASSFNLFASTGNANDGLLFILVIIGFLLLLLGIFAGANFLRNNGKKLAYNFISSLKKLVKMLKDYLYKLKADYFKLSYFLD